MILVSPNTKANCGGGGVMRRFLVMQEVAANKVLQCFSSASQLASVCDELEGFRSLRAGWRRAWSQKARINLPQQQPFRWLGRGAPLYRIAHLLVVVGLTARRQGCRPPVWVRR